MNITCPSCKARYSVDDARVPRSGVTIECPSCGHTFVARRATAAERARSAVPLPGQKETTQAPASPTSASGGGVAPSPRAGSAVPLPGSGQPSTPPPSAVALPGRPAVSADLGDLELGLDDGSTDVPSPSAPSVGGDSLDFIEEASVRAGLAEVGGRAEPELRVRHRNGRVLGPYGREHLMALIRTGELTGNEDLSEDGVSWRAMTSDPEFNALLNELGDDEPPFGAGAPGPQSLDLGLEPEAPPPPISGLAPQAPPSSMDELMGSLELDAPPVQEASLPLTNNSPPSTGETPTYPPLGNVDKTGAAESLEVAEIPDMPPMWDTYKVPIVAFLTVAVLVLVGVYTHFFTSWGALGIPKLVETLTYEPPPPPPAAPPPPPPKLANPEEIQSLLTEQSYESFRSAIVTLEKAGPNLPNNALALAKARVLASLAYGVDVFPLSKAQEAVAALAAVDPDEALDGDAAAVQNEKLKAQSGLAILEGESAGPIAELRRAVEARPEDPELGVLLGAAHMLAESPAEAMKAYDAAMVANANYAPALRGMAQVAEAEGDEEAVLWYEKAVAAEPSDARSALDAARLYGEAGQLGPQRRMLAAAGRGANRGLLPEARASTVLQAAEAFEAANALSSVSDLAKEAVRLDPGNPRAVALAALSQALKGETKPALAALDAVVARDPANVDALVARARVHAMEGDVAKSLMDLDNARPHDQGIEVLIWQARVNRRYGKTKDAQRALQLATRRPNSAPAYVELSRLALAQGNVDEAHDYATKAVKVEAGYLEAQVQLGRTLSRRGEAVDAGRAFRRALEIDPENVGALLGVANAMRDRASKSRRPESSEELGRSIPIYLEAIASHPGNPEVLFEYGRALELQGDMSGAIELYKQAASVNEEDVRPHLKMVAALLNETPPKLDEAAASLEKAHEIELASGAKAASVRFWEARLALASKRPKDAVAAMNKAADIEPSNAAYQLELGRALEMNNSLFEAVSAYKKAIKLNSRLADAHRALGRTSMERHRYKEARDYFRQYRKLAPEDPSVWADIGVSYSQQNKDAEALTAFKTALNANPMDIRSLLEVGQIQSRRGREREAQRTFRKATSIDSESGAAWCMLGLSLGQSRVTRDARSALRRCVKLDNSPPDLADSARDLLDG